LVYAYLCNILTAAKYTYFFLAYIYRVIHAYLQDDIKLNTTMLAKINETVSFLISKGFGESEVGIILGTGLGNFTGEIEIITEAGYETIPYFVTSTVDEIKGRLIYGTASGKKVYVMQGRFHYYEGYDMQQITFPVRVMKMMGIKMLLLSNIAGAMNPDLKKGMLMLIEDHINFLPENPLRGINYDELGPRFPDMSRPYDPELNRKLELAAKNEGIELKKGDYVAVQGPNLETRAEYRFFRYKGADAIGMSTVPEVIVANHMKLTCAAISIITDECDPDNLVPANIPEIFAIAAKAEKNVIKIWLRFLKDL